MITTKTITNSSQAKTIRKIWCDVMLRDRFICRMAFPVQIEGNDLLLDTMSAQRYVEHKRPTLKGTPYRIML